MAEMKTKYIINFNQRTRLKNQFFCTENIKRFKTKPKIKRIRTEMKSSIYEQFELDDIVEKKIHCIKGTKNKLKIKRRKKQHI